MHKFEVCIVGGGASGSMLAVLLAQKGIKVCVIDSFDAPAKKLLVTGNGKCNITNKNMSSDFYNQNIDVYLNEFGYKQAMETFARFGLDIYADEMGRCYPISNTAKTVQFVFQNQFNKLGIEYVSANVTDIKKIARDKLDNACCEPDKICQNVGFDDVCNNYFFEVEAVDKKIYADKLALACGINDFSKHVCEKFNVNIIKTCHSLVALKTKQNTKKLDGKRISNVSVTATCAGESATEVGELLFKDAGLSGICIFNLSALFAKNKTFDGKISINLLKNWSKKQIIEKINKKLSIFDYVHEALESMFFKELAMEILKRSEIKSDMLSKNLSNQQIEKIVLNITNLEFDVCGAYQNHQVISGGVDLRCLTQNLESCQNKNLYFCGEICDVDAVCGGYNLQWAWTSAYIVSQAIIKDVK